MTLYTNIIFTDAIEVVASATCWARLFLVPDIEPQIPRLFQNADMGHVKQNAEPRLHLTFITRPGRKWAHVVVQ